MEPTINLLHSPQFPLIFLFYFHVLFIPNPLKNLYFQTFLTVHFAAVSICAGGIKVPVPSVKTRRCTCIQTNSTQFKYSKVAADLKSPTYLFLRLVLVKHSKSILLCIISFRDYFLCADFPRECLFWPFPTIFICPTALSFSSGEPFYH